MLGIGIGELVVIALILLIVVGPQRLPSLMRAFGKGMREFRRASHELKRTVGWDEMMEETQIPRSLEYPPEPAALPSRAPKPPVIEGDAYPHDLYDEHGHPKVDNSKLDVDAHGPDAFSPSTEPKSVAEPISSAAPQSESGAPVKPNS